MCSYRRCFNWTLLLPVAITRPTYDWDTFLKMFNTRKHLRLRETVRPRYPSTDGVVVGVTCNPRP